MQDTPSLQCMIVQCGSTSWFSAREESGFAALLHITLQLQRQQASVREYSNVRYDDKQQHSALKKIRPSPQGKASTLVVRLSNPVRSCFSSCKGRTRPGLPRDRLLLRLQNIKRLVLYHSTSRYVRHPHPDIGSQLGADISTPDLRKPFRERETGIFSLRSGQIRGA